MDTINVKDLPEPIARVIEAMVDVLRQQLVKKNDHKKQPVQLLVWSGKPIGKLTREEIYEDVV